MVQYKKTRKIRNLWQVGVHFGNYYTNVYINYKNIVKPLPLESLHLTITYSDQETRPRVLTEFFIPEHFIPLDKPLPLPNILTTRQSENLAKERPIFDGRIYMPKERFSPQEYWIETNININTLESISTRLFLKNLALIISALAAKNGIKEIQWCLSYPSSLSQQQKRDYAKTWQNITQELQQTTGIIQHSPNYDDLQYFRSESLATAQYFADQEELSLDNTICINMGDETSDISIWQADNDHFQMIYQCSLNLARRQLISQFLEKNPQFLSEKFDVDLQDLQGLLF